MTIYPQNKKCETGMARKGKRFVQVGERERIGGFYFDLPCETPQSMVTKALIWSI